MDANPQHLFYAVKNNNIEMMETLLNEHVYEPNFINYLVLYSAFKGHVYAMDLLRRHGGTINDVIFNIDRFPETYTLVNKTPLILACQFGHIDVIKYLIENGVDVNYKNPNGMTALMIACSHRQIDAVKTLLESQLCDVNITDDYGETAIFYAKSPQIIDWLLTYGGDINHQNNHGKTALLLSFFKNNDDLAIKLLEYGADINLNSAEIQSLLADAIIEDNYERIKIMLEYGVDMTSPDPLFSAVRLSKHEIIDMMLTHGANPNLQSSETGDSLLLLATRRHDHETMKMLLDHGADPNSQHIHSKTPTLLYAIIWNDYDATKILLDHGANPKIGLFKNKTALEIAREQHKDRRIYELLKSYAI